MNIICVLLSCFKSSPCSGLVTTMTILCLVALGKLLANRASVNFHLLFDKSPTKTDVAQVARVERVRQILGGQLGTNMLGTAGTWADKLGTAGTWANPGQLPDKDSSAQLTQPMLAGIGNHRVFLSCLSNDSKCESPQPGYLDSSESSRSSTATHSRTSSEGVTPPYAVLPNNNTANNQHARGQNQVKLEPSGSSEQQLAAV